MRWVHKKKQNSHWYCLKWCSSSHVIQDKEKIRRVVSQSDLSLWWRLHHVVLFTELSAQIGEWVYDFRHCLALQLASPAPSENIHRIEKKPLIEVHHCKNDAEKFFKREQDSCPPARVQCSVPFYVLQWNWVV